MIIRGNIFIFVIFIIGFHFSCTKKGNPSTPAGYTYQVPPETDDGWETASLSDFGLDVNRIEDLVKSIRYRIFSSPGQTTMAICGGSKLITAIIRHLILIRPWVGEVRKS